ncbi:S8 family serine peptidase [Halobiforma nitratireducens]|uniref:Subtilisin-like serine protease n=1 Tax=Halobiforma nitratireducens JCM 10879 TaxID=1227454 RepID=M0M9Z6_9EURY|nr:S8 family serine peptidase [Halobiforma nitratireducens]EMA42607.1 subtilisin-like serine protease [Halobiforma nitratireducens JCM 10879]
MPSRRICRHILVVGIALLALGLTGVVVADAAPATLEDDRDADPDVEIDAELQTTDGTTTVVVRFEERSEHALQPLSEEQRVESLQTHASDTQAPLTELAADIPGLEIERQFWLTNAVAVNVDTDRVDLERLGAVDGVTAIHENYEIEPHGATTTGSSSTAGPAPSVPESTTDPMPRSESGYTDGLEAIDAPTAWSAFDTRGEGVRIAVLDTGIDPDHDDITFDADNWAEFDAGGTHVDSEPHDHDGHGTHVSGTVAGGNTTGTAIGVAPEAELMHGKVLGEDSSTFTAVAAGMEWAVENDADVLSLSLGGGSKVDAIAESVRNANQAGTTVVTSVGNEGAGTSTSPGDVYDAFSIGASDDTTIAGFSSSETVHKDEWSDPPEDWPDEYDVPDVVAPGVDVVSASPGNAYAEKDGTSMAAPHVSGAIALLYANADEDLSPAETRDLLATTADDLGADPTRQGAGRINVTDALLEHSRETLDPTIGPETANVSQSTTITVETDHPIERYHWEIDGTTATTTEPEREYTFEELGASEVSVTLEDIGGEKLPVSSTIDVVDEVPPSAALAANATESVEVGLETVALDASESTDNHEIEHYEWAVDGEPLETTTGPEIEHTFEDTGTRTVTVTVVDESGNADTATIAVEVVDTTPPTAVLEAPPEAVAFTETTFDASDSTDNHEIDRYEWALGDGTETTTDEPVVTHEYEETGNRTVTLTVFDEAGHSHEVTESVTVVAPPTITVDSPDDGAAFADGSVSVDYTLEHTDLEGAAGLEYRILDAADEPVGNWTSADFEATRESMSFDLTTPELADGTYTIELRLVDDEGDDLSLPSATDDVTVTVKTSPPTIDADVGPASDEFDSIGAHNPAVVDVSVTDPRHASTTVVVVGPDEQQVREWDRSAETGDGELTTLEWNATDVDGEPVESGEYEIVVTAADDLGNEAQVDETATVDTTPPTLAIESIDGGHLDEDSRYGNETDDISVTITADDGLGDPDGLESVAVDLRATETNYRHASTVEHEADGTWVGTVDLEAVPDEGTYDIAVSVTDTANNTAATTATEQVRYDRTAPRLAATIRNHDPGEETADVRVRSSEPLREAPTVTVTPPSGEERTLTGLTGTDDATWAGTFDASEQGQYEVTATGEDRAGNPGSDDAQVTIDAVSTTNRTVTVYNERTGTFVAFNTTADVEETFVTISETRSAPHPLDRGTSGVDFLTAELAENLDASLSNATIGMPVDEGRLPDGVAPDADAVGLQWYNESAEQWEDRDLETREIDMEQDGETIEGTYWTATVDHFSTYGVVAEDGTPPELVSVDPADGETLASETETRTIELEYADDHSGVDTSSIALSIDGEDVTDSERTQITSTHTTHEDFAVTPDETYEIVLEIADEAGNEATYETMFDVAADDDNDEDGDGDGDGSGDDGDSGDSGDNDGGSGGSIGGGGSLGGGGDETDEANETDETTDAGEADDQATDDPSETDTGTDAIDDSTTGESESEAEAEDIASDERDEPSSDVDGGSDDSDGIPGFGVAGTIVAMVVTLALHKVRRK